MGLLGSHIYQYKQNRLERRLERKIELQPTYYRFWDLKVDKISFHFFITIGILSMPQIMVSLNFYPKLNEELVIHKAFLFTEMASEYFYCIIIPIGIMAKKRKIRNFLWNEFLQSYWNLKIKSIYFCFLKLQYFSIFVLQLWSHEDNLIILLQQVLALVCTIVLTLGFFILGNSHKKNTKDPFTAFFIYCSKLHS